MSDSLADHLREAAGAGDERLATWLARLLAGDAGEPPARLLDATPNTDRPLVASPSEPSQGEPMAAKVNERVDARPAVADVWSARTAELAALFTHERMTMIDYVLNPTLFATMTRHLAP